MTALKTAEYRCRDCGEIYPLMLSATLPTVVGGITANRFVTHGPGCNGQEFDRVDALSDGEVIWK